MRIEKAKLDKKNYENYEMIKNLHLNWYSYALKALMAQFGRQLYDNLKRR